MIDRNDPRYLSELLKQKSQNDPKEIAIREKVRAVMLKENWAKYAFEKVRQQQIDYIKDAVANIQNDAYVHDLTQKNLREISEEMKSKIVEGKHLLDKVPKQHPAI